MSSFSNYIEAQIVSTFLTDKGTKLALLTNEPTLTNPTAYSDAASFTQPTYTGYATQAANWTTVNESTGQFSNTAVITFPSVPAGEGPIAVYGVAVYDSGSNMLLHAPLTTMKSLAEGDTISFASGAIVFTLN